MHVCYKCTNIFYETFSWKYNMIEKDSFLAETSNHSLNILFHYIYRIIFYCSENLWYYFLYIPHDFSLLLVINQSNLQMWKFPISYVCIRVSWTRWCFSNAFLNRHFRKILNSWKYIDISNYLKKTSYIPFKVQFLTNVY